ncbi:WXG100 family type VII secretion target [Thalassiella azotivora]
MANGGGGVHVEHGALEAQAANLANTKNELESVLTRLQGQIQELISSGFVTDAASGSFGEAHERWTTAARQCVSELELMSQYLGKASEAFASVDQQFRVNL